MRTKEQHEELLAQSEASRVPTDAKGLQGRLSRRAFRKARIQCLIATEALARQKKKSEDLSFCFLVTLAGLALLAGIALGLAVYFA